MSGCVIIRFMDQQPEVSVAATAVNRAWYGDSILRFLASDARAIVGALAKNSRAAIRETQSAAWFRQIAILQEALVPYTGTVLFEFNIPRMGRRADVVVLIDHIVFVLEFKAGATTFDRAALDQVWDYALDLKNFHEASHAVALAPILIATEAVPIGPQRLYVDDDQVLRPICATPAELEVLIGRVLREIQSTAFDHADWCTASYLPTPTIVEAARALYANHAVEAIARFDAGAVNLRTTSKRIEELVDEASRLGRKCICFVTGVPGAGKTLVGLNVATQRRAEDTPTHAVFLSGNGPLVAVLREALTRDEVDRQRALGNRVRKGSVGERVKAFIQNVHHFRDDALVDASAPPEHVVIFDEAQRAWNAQQTANFMKRKKNRDGFTLSEPEFLISCMDRHPDWAVIICLVGGGQEINTGEAGIEAWIQAIANQFPDWQMYLSSNLTDSEYASGQALSGIARRPQTYFEPALHLAVSMRSFRAETVSSFVKALLDCELATARETLRQMRARYPVVLSRDLSLAKAWVRQQARGSERFGLVASSKAQRLKPHAIDIRVEVNPIHYFLNEKEDTRSSFYLEDAATEFQVQGLELDWTCVTWDADLRHTGGGWTFHDFRGNRWTNIRQTEGQNYLRNAYRVLLTRARQGMVIFVPAGDPLDPTRAPEYYNPIYAYLNEIGIPELVAAKSE